jgi:hypothetical protein
MSWKESKVRLLPPPQALNPQDHKNQQGADRKPDIQDLFLLASQATALRNTPLSSSASEYATVTTVSVTGSNPVSMAGPSTHLQPVSTVQYPGPNIKIEPVILPSSSSSTTNYVPLDSAMMPPPPPPPPRPPASPGVSSTSGDSDSDTAHYSPIIPNNPSTANNCQHPGGNIPPSLLGKDNFLFCVNQLVDYSA